MSTTVEIPGGTATVREPDELRGRDRLLIRSAAIAAMPAFAKLPESARATPDGETSAEAQTRMADALVSVALSEDEALALGQAQEATVVALLVSWTLDRPLPTRETIGDLPGDLYDALIAAVGARPVSALGTDFTPQRGADGKPDETVPTDASRPSSDTSSTPGPEATISTSTPSNDGVPTDIEPFTPA